MQAMRTRSNFQIVPQEIKKYVASFLPPQDLNRLKKVDSEFYEAAQYSYFTGLNPRADGRVERPEDSFDVFCHPLAFFERRKTEYLTFGPEAKAQIRNFFRQNASMVIDLENHTITLNIPTTGDTLIRYNRNPYHIIERPRNDLESSFLDCLRMQNNQLHLRLSREGIESINFRHILFSTNYLPLFFLNLCPHPDAIKLFLTGIPSLATRNYSYLINSIPHAPVEAIDAFILSIPQHALVRYINFQDREQNHDSALIAAVRCGREDVVRRLLLVPSIDTELKDDQGKTASDIAFEAGCTEIFMLILGVSRRPADQ